MLVYISKVQIFSQADANYEFTYRNSEKKGYRGYLKMCTFCLAIVILHLTILTFFSDNKWEVWDKK